MSSESGHITTEKHVTASRTECSGGGDQTQTVRTTSSSFDSQLMGPAEEVSSVAQALVGKSTTLTEALKAAAMRVGHKPVEASDAAAIKEVEARATGYQLQTGVGIAAFAEEAVARNTEMGQNQTTISDVIADVDNKLERDRSVRSDDVEAVAEMELSHNPDYRVTPGGVAESVAAAFKLNTKPSL